MTKEIKTWKDETGREIPLSYITKTQKAREALAAKLLKLSQKQHDALKELKAQYAAICNEVYQAALAEYNVEQKDRKGNFTWFNFDRSIKVETNVNAQIKFDDMLIGLCKDKLDEFLTSNLTGTETFIKDLIMDAFATSKGKLDTSKVMSLLKHKSKIADTRYHEAMKILEESIRRPNSKTYYAISFKDANGEYQSVDLNFSSISLPAAS